MKVKINSKARAGLIDAMTWGNDWQAVDEYVERGDRSKDWYNAVIKVAMCKRSPVELTEKEYQDFLKDASGVEGRMSDIASENSEYEDMKERVFQYRAAIKWLNEQD